MSESRDIENLLAEVAEKAEQNPDAATKLYRSKRPPTDPSQVYSIRIPVSQLGRIRDLAARYQMAPTAMLRQWILERLESEERSGNSGAGESRIASESLDHPTESTNVIFIAHHGRQIGGLHRQTIERDLRMDAGRSRMVGV